MASSPAGVDGLPNLTGGAAAGGGYDHAHHHDCGGHGAGRTNATESRSGPAKMATQQEVLRREISRRFRALRGAIRTTVTENDALRIKGADTSTPTAPRDLVNAADDITPGDGFQFETNAGRQEAFLNWFRDALDRGLIERSDLATARAGEHWTATYVESSYGRGLNWGTKQARAAGLDVDGITIGQALNRPVHRKALETLYTRAYSQLDGIGNAAEQRIARVLSNELASGSGTKKMARALTSEVSAIEGNRGITFARTETMNAHAQATGRRFQELGIEKANVATSNPCAQCRAYAANGPYPVKEVMAALPVHPNCVCAMIGVVD